MRQLAIFILFTLCTIIISAGVSLLLGVRDTITPVQLECILHVILSIGFIGVIAAVLSKKEEGYH